MDTSVRDRKINKLINHVVSEKQAALPDSWYPETRFTLSRLQFQVEIFWNADIYSEYTMTILLQPRAEIVAI